MRTARPASGASVRRLEPGADLHEASGGLEAYRGLVITDIDATRDVIELSGGDVIAVGQATADVTEEARRRIQIREVIRAHLEKERELFPLGIKVLSLFFIDEVAKYRDYRRADTRGEYARVFAAEYAEQVASCSASWRRPDGGRVPRLPRGHPRREHAPGVLLCRQEDRPAIDGDLQRAARAGQSDRRRRLRPHPRDKERLLSLRRAGAVHLLPLGPARRLGQPQRVRAWACSRGATTPSPGARRSAAGCACPSTSTATGPMTRRPCTSQRVDGRDRRVLHRLRRRPAAGAQRVARHATRRARAAIRGRRRAKAQSPPRDDNDGPRESGRPVVLDSGVLIGRCVAALNDRLRVDALRYVVRHGELRADVSPAARPATPVDRARGHRVAPSQVLRPARRASREDTAHPADHRVDRGPGQPGHVGSVPAESRPVHRRSRPPDQRATGLTPVRSSAIIGVRRGVASR